MAETSSLPHDIVPNLTKHDDDDEIVFPRRRVDSPKHSMQGSTDSSFLNSATAEPTHDPELSPSWSLRPENHSLATASSASQDISARSVTQIDENHQGSTNEQRLHEDTALIDLTSENGSAEHEVGKEDALQANVDDPRPELDTQHLATSDVADNSEVGQPSIRPRHEETNSDVQQTIDHDSGASFESLSGVEHVEEAGRLEKATVEEEPHNSSQKHVQAAHNASTASTTTDFQVPPSSNMPGLLGGPKESASTDAEAPTTLAALDSSSVQHVDGQSEAGAAPTEEEPLLDPKGLAESVEPDVAKSPARHDQLLVQPMSQTASNEHDFIEVERPSETEVHAASEELGANLSNTESSTQISLDDPVMRADAEITPDSIKGATNTQEPTPDNTEYSLQQDVGNLLTGETSTLSIGGLAHQGDYTGQAAQDDEPSLTQVESSFSAQDNHLGQAGVISEAAEATSHGQKKPDSTVPPSKSPAEPSGIYIAAAEEAPARISTPTLIVTTDDDTAVDMITPGTSPGPRPRSRSHSRSPSPLSASYAVTTQGYGHLAEERGEEIVDNEQETHEEPDSADLDEVLETDEPIAQASRRSSPFPRSYSVSSQGSPRSPFAAPAEGQESTPAATTDFALPGEEDRRVSMSIEALTTAPTIDSSAGDLSELSTISSMVTTAPAGLETPEIVGDFPPLPPNSSPAVASAALIGHLDQLVDDLSAHSDVPTEEFSDIEAASEIPEPPLSPRSDLGPSTPFDTRSEVSVASHIPVAPDTPRIDLASPHRIATDITQEREEDKITPRIERKLSFEPSEEQIPAMALETPKKSSLPATDLEPAGELREEVVKTVPEMETSDKIKDAILGQPTPDSHPEAGSPEDGVPPTLDEHRSVPLTVVSDRAGDIHETIPSTDRIAAEEQSEPETQSGTFIRESENEEGQEAATETRLEDLSREPVMQTPPPPPRSVSPASYSVSVQGGSPLATKPPVASPSPLRRGDSLAVFDDDKPIEPLEHTKPSEPTTHVDSTPTDEPASERPVSPFPASYSKTVQGSTSPMRRTPEPSEVNMVAEQPVTNAGARNGVAGVSTDQALTSDPSPSNHEDNTLRLSAQEFEPPSTREDHLIPPADVEPEPENIARVESVHLNGEVAHDSRAADAETVSPIIQNAVESTEEATAESQAPVQDATTEAEGMVHPLQAHDEAVSTLAVEEKKSQALIDADRTEQDVESQEPKIDGSALAPVVVPASASEQQMSSPRDVVVPDHSTSTRGRTQDMEVSLIKEHPIDEKPLTDMADVSVAPSVETQRTVDVDELPPRPAIPVHGLPASEAAKMDAPKIEHERTFAPAGDRGGLINPTPVEAANSDLQFPTPLSDDVQPTPEVSSSKSKRANRISLILPGGWASHWPTTSPVAEEPSNAHGEFVSSPRTASASLPEEEDEKKSSKCVIM